MSSEQVISVSGLSKAYRLYRGRSERLRQVLFRRWGKEYGTEFWALKNVSFGVRKGECVGVIGRNGSGKSTLLQVIAGILKPTSGSVSVTGRVTALLELGSGFDPEFTGRENVYLNGTLFGVPRQEMAQRLRRSLPSPESVNTSISP
jgi:lipopolysaccharide transport system ATP-binding protein